MFINMQAQKLLSALYIAIAEQRKGEAKQGYTRDSALVAGWVDVSEAIKRGESVTIIGSV